MKEIIRLDDIRRDFRVGDETVHALRGVTFTICEGEFVTIMGTSGSGKSTLLNTLGCLDTPSAGEYYLDGTAVRSMDKNQRCHTAQPQDRFRLPELQPAAQDDGHRRTSNCR